MGVLDAPRDRRIPSLMDTVNMDAVALNRILNDPAGPVGRFLAEAAIRVESQAKVNATGDRHNPARQGPAVRTGRLRSSIYWRLEAGKTYGSQASGPVAVSTSAELGGLRAAVTCPVHYAGYVETGTSRSRPYPFLRPALSAA